MGRRAHGARGNTGEGVAVSGAWWRFTAAPRAECTCDYVDVTGFGDTDRKVLGVRDPDCPVHRQSVNGEWKTEQQLIVDELREAGLWDDLT